MAISLLKAYLPKDIARLIDKQKSIKDIYVLLSDEGYNVPHLLKLALGEYY